MKKMDPEIKERWATKLEELGKAGKETFAALRNGDYYSPDGVLTDLYLKEHGLDWEVVGGKQTAHGRSCAMPDLCRDWAGLDRRDPYLPSFSNLTVSMAQQRLLTMDSLSRPLPHLGVYGNLAHLIRQDL